MPERPGTRVLSASAFERDGLRIDIPRYCAPSTEARKEEFHLEQAAMLRLADVLELVSGIRQTKPRDGPHKVEVQVDGAWHDLTDCLVKEGWGVHWKTHTARHRFDPEHYPIKVDA